MAETDYVTTLNVVSWVLTSLIIVITLARILGRTLVTKQTGWDDFFMLLGSVSALVCSSLVTVGVSYGVGRHQAEITNPNDLSEAIKYTIIAPVFSIISSTSIRFCDPPQKQWQPWIPGTCINPQVQRDVGFVQSSYNALMDVIVAVFPAVFITKLKISRKMKMGLSLLMGGSVFAAGATIVKVYLLKDLDKHADITWYWAPITLWYTAEMDVIIIVGTIPTLWPLIRFIRRKKIPSRDQGIYDEVTSDVSYEHGSEGIQLGGSATRVLQEVDNMLTYGTWNGEGGQ
ncbi:hypothetical protein GQX73_g6482 [Xylaria multiplex]|uniref:Rhodopsin domain-containing protein n=1 Tax=Xylaria multiplex TaxID=323545 RepID=A0A7C8MSA7_9PEZI|nr:hypothetical protein GQX73_g6482 [Xylaria multiplex]